MIFTDLQEVTMRKVTICLVVVAFLFCFNASSFAAATATFLGTDTTTLGSWQGMYGSVGYYIPNGPLKIPSDGSTFSPGAALTYTWATNVTSANALRTGASTDIAACWYNNLGSSFPSLTLDVIVPAGQTQTVALYLMDYDHYGRSESVSVTDANNDLPPLQGPNVISGANFVNGEYLIWAISGEVHINITLVNGVNAVASGIFFGANAPVVTASAYFNYSSSSVTVSANGTTLTPIATLTLLPGNYLLHARVQVNNVLVPTSYETGECEFSQPSAESIPNILHVWNAPAGGFIEVTLDAPYSPTTTSVISVGCAYLAGSAQSIFGGTISALAIPAVNTTNQ